MSKAIMLSGVDLGIKPFFYTEVVLPFDATEENRYTVTIPTLPEKYFLIVKAMDEIEQKETTYGALAGSYITETRGYTLRPNGTVGTDTKLFTVSGNNIRLGGSYGVFYEGKRYSISIFEIEVKLNELL